MADDIVTRLRHAEDNGICEWQVLIDAADEIERLRAALAGIDRLHHCFDSMDGSAAICWHCGRNWPCETHQKVQEARRG